jgi:hypothetical protein
MLDRSEVNSSEENWRRRIVRPSAAAKRAVSFLLSAPRSTVVRSISNASSEGADKFGRDVGRSRDFSNGAGIGHPRAAAKVAPATRSM